MIISSLSYTERANDCLSAIGRRLLQLLDQKQTNLAFSADVTTAEELLALAEKLGPYICVLKTHIDILSDFTPEVALELKRIALQHHFLLFEDRKFADIGNTVKQQYEGGIYHIADWADLVNAHILPGVGVIKGLAEVGRKKNRGLILIAEMSSKGNLLDKQYALKTLQLAEQYADFVIGFITQHTISEDRHWINFTPGVRLGTESDGLGQQYITPRKAILEQGSDVIIVGRGIIDAPDPVFTAKEYAHEAWQAYLERSNS